MNYSFDISIFVKNFLPIRKRTLLHISWLQALLAPMKFWSTQFFTNYRTGFLGNTILSYTSTKIFNGGDLVYYNGIIYICIVSGAGNLPTNVAYFNVKSFAFGDLIHGIDNDVYLCIADNPSGISPANINYWYLMQKNFLGLNDRIRSNAQIIIYEYILNKWFSTNFNYPASVNDVYIINNPSDIDGFIIGDTDLDTNVVSVNDNQQDAFINADFTYTPYNFTINIPLLVYDALRPSDSSGTTATKDAIVKNFADKYNLAGLAYSINPY